METPRDGVDAHQRGMGRPEARTSSRSSSLTMLSSSRRNSPWASIVRANRSVATSTVPPRSVANADQEQEQASRPT